MATYKSIAYDQVLGNPSAMVLLQTSSVTDGDGDLTFTGLSSDYKEYMITHLNYKSQNDGAGLAIQGTTDGTNYNIAMTTTHFSAYHLEDDSATSLAYNTSGDQAQGAAFNPLTRNVGSGDDEGTCGYIHIFDPSNTTFVKHYLARSQAYAANDNSYDNFSAGYFNTTSAITAIQFQPSTGDMEAGTFKLYGVN